MVTTDHIIHAMNGIAVEEKGVIIPPGDVTQPVGIPVESLQSTEWRSDEVIGEISEEAKEAPSAE